jgi:hypothetical protein
MAEPRPYHPAFPSRSPSGADRTGMSLRDFFAAAALTGLAAARANSGDWTAGNVSFLAEEAYVIADAMLTERVSE